MVAPHGVRGDLRMLPDVDWPDEVPGRICLGGTWYRLLSARPHKRVWLLRLEGVEDRNAAEALVGCAVEVAAGDLSPRAGGRYYDFQLLGLRAVDEAGAYVGAVGDIIHTGANDVYALRTDAGEEILLPAIPDCVLAVDLAGGTMTVRLQEWED